VADALTISWDFAHHGTARDARRLRFRREGARAPAASLLDRI
jgi:hypothetical protein